MAPPPRKFSDKLLDALSPVVYVVGLLYTAIMAYVDLASTASYASELYYDLRVCDTLMEIESFIDLMDYFIGASESMLKLLAVELVIVAIFIYLKSRSMNQIK